MNTREILKTQLHLQLLRIANPLKYCFYIYYKDIFYYKRNFNNTITSSVIKNNQSLKILFLYVDTLLDCSIMQYIISFFLCL